jgi:hypothetical protein
LAEFAVYGFLTYSSMLMLIICGVKGLPEERSRINVLAGAIFLIPGLICAPVLATSGVNIQIQHTDDIIKNLNNTQTWSDISTNNIVLQNPIWGSVHMMIFFVLLFYIIRQFMLFLTAPGL